MKVKIYVIIIILLIIMLVMLSKRKFPTSEYIKGFARTKGVPDVHMAKQYYASSDEAIRKCAENSFCVGVSAQRLFLVNQELKHGETVFTIKGQPGETHSYVKDAHPTIYR